MIEKMRTFAVVRTSLIVVLMLTAIAASPASLKAQGAAPAPTATAPGTPPATATPPTASEPSAAPVQEAPATPGSVPSATAQAPSASPETPAAQAEPGTPMPIENLPLTGPGAPAASAVGETTVGPNPNLPHDLSPWAMFMQADMIVKSVMIGLGIASVITWTVWLVKSIELFASRGRLKRGLRAVASDTSLAAASHTLGDGGGLLRALIDVAALELRMSTDTPDKNGIKERVASRLERIESGAVRSMNKGTGVLATIGATAPFVGLFGTVWGIMNSFIGISKSQTTNLAVVAPGIAEALLATAIGLVAAIPAVIIYNGFSRGIGAYRAMAGDASAEVMRLVSRDLDRVTIHRHARAAE